MPPSRGISCLSLVLYGIRISSEGLSVIFSMNYYKYFQASVRNVHLISARLATPASSSDQNGTFIFTINDNNNLVVVNVFLKLELVVRWGDTTSRCRTVCLQLNLNHFVQVRLPWESGLGISHKKTKDCHRREQKPRQIQILFLSADRSIWSFNRAEVTGPPTSREYKLYTWSRDLTMQSCRDHWLIKLNTQNCKYLHLCILQSQSML